jgi:hypothetical protein
MIKGQSEGHSEGHYGTLSQKDMKELLARRKKHEKKNKRLKVQVLPQEDNDLRKKRRK